MIATKKNDHAAFARLQARVELHAVGETLKLITRDIEAEGKQTRTEVLIAFDTSEGQVCYSTDFSTFINAMGGLMMKETESTTWETHDSDKADGEGMEVSETEPEEWPETEPEEKPEFEIEDREAMPGEFDDIVD